MRPLEVIQEKSMGNALYFPNLNGLRFIAALAVIIHHAEAFRWIFGLPNAWRTVPAIGHLGDFGVVLFFVLSGFLITYLLLEEERVHGRIEVGRFYVRRALRIWPLYYLFVALALFALPYLSFFGVP